MDKRKHYKISYIPTCALFAMLWIITIDVTSNINVATKRAMIFREWLYMLEIR